MNPSGPGDPITTVLLVEDHADSRHMYAEFLRADFTVVEAEDGIRALEIMGQSRPDVVITDLALPRMDGFELVTRMREDARLREIPVIALSGYSSTEHEMRALEAGSNVVLRKPCLPDELARAVVSASKSRKDS